MTREEKRAELNASLCQFTGSETWYRHALNQRVLYTDGVLFLAETAGAFWLVDEIALANKFQRKVGREEFQVWTLKVKGSRATLVCDDGNGNVVYRKSIPFTDFPLDEIKLWFENGTIMLPSER